MQQLINYINSIVKLNSDSIEALERLAEIKCYKKNQFIISKGERCNNIWYLKKGLVRKFYLVDGEEVTTWIHAENEIFTSLQSYSQMRPATESIQALEDVEVIGISRENSRLMSEFPAFVIFSNSLMEQQFVNIDVHTRELNSKDAKGKYEYLGTIAPEVVKRAKLKYIASLLGITPETLSRIRKYQSYL